MSKAILKKNLMEKIGITEKQAEEVIECFIETINKETLENKKFQITGWGTFKLKETERHEKFIPLLLVNHIDFKYYLKKGNNE